MPIKIVLDCDPGHDDALAILLAHGNPEIELTAITTVAGNQTLDKTSLNARRICTVAGITTVPVAAGCDRPLVRDLVTAGNIHGESGLDGPTFPPPSVELEDVHAVDLMIELIMASPGEITLVPTGPLTNVAMALRKEPRIKERVREVVLMGGSYTRGNRTPAAEFNIFVDPEAAEVVFEAGWPLTMVGLDLTHQALVTREVIERIRRVETPLSEIVVELLEFYRGTNRRTHGMEAAPLHDPCTIARLIRRGVVECTPAFVAVETQGRWTRGMTVTDFHERDGHSFNCQVATKLDVEAFWDLMVGSIAAIGTPLPT